MNTLDTDVFATRTAAAAADEQFIRRWSPRAFSGQALSEGEVLTLIEAARWAPSCFNSQPWRFVYATSDSDDWPALFGLLMDMNQLWAAKAGALMAVVAKTTFDNGETAPTYAFDTGSAWMALALQAQHMGLASHAMWGFHHDQAAAVLELPEDHVVQAMVAVGHPGEVEDLPEKYQAREAPSPRLELKQIAMPGRFQLPE